MEGLNFENDIFRLYAMYASILVVKMICMSLMTSVMRVIKKVYVTPEDSVVMGKRRDPKKYVRIDPDIERVRQCHRNDMENIPVFLVIGLLYVLTGPSVFEATCHFRVFVASRILHTIAYLTPLPQPSRALGFMIGAATTLSMAIQVWKLGQL